ncbi:Fc.00g043110.m01.CDS01 [Cosmosporella sp. VM-42]
MTKLEDYVVTDRGGIIENRHGVHAAVVGSSGKLLFAVGSPFRITLARSAAKPAQALAVLETGALEQFGFEEADLALMCAPHSSEPRHVTHAREVLAKVKAEESHLACGGHPAVNDSVNRDWIKRDYFPTAVCNNCSGKDAGMLGGA